MKYWKKIFLIVLSIILILSITPIGLINVYVRAATTYRDNKGYTYTLRGYKATIIDGPNTTNLTIPTTVGDSFLQYEVEGIAANAFAHCNLIQTITIPDCVEFIGKGAFTGCGNIKKISLPFVGASRDAFDSDFFCYIFGYSGLIPTEYIDVICGSSIYSLPYKLSEVIVTDATKISYQAFSDCSTITSITIKGNLTSISYRAFYNCSNLTEIAIPANIVSIDDYAFEKCDSLTDVWYTGTKEQKSRISIYSANECLEHATWHYNTCSNKHTYYSDCDESCNNCDWKRETTVAHYFSSKCDTECNDCYSVRETSTSHTFINNCDIECDYCNYIRTISHAYDNDNDIICNICDEVRTPYAPLVLSFTDTTVTLIPNTNCEYSMDGIMWQKNNVFTDLLAGTSYTFYQRFAETDTYEASDKSVGTSVTTDKSKQTLIPDAPTFQSFTASSITLNPVDGCEYSKDGTTWQMSNVFSGLSCGTEYTFYQRYKETATTYVGKSSAALVTRTDKGTQTAPSAPTLENKTHNSVTLTKISGCEYSRDGINWQTSNVFTGLTPETNYMFYQRMAETDRYYIGPASPALIVKTAEEPICVVNPQFHSYDNSCDTVCNFCGEIRSIIHSYSKATCTTPKICTVCGDTEGEALGHDYADATCTEVKTCKVCKTTSGSKLSHKSDSGTITKKATCTAAGTKTYKCILCNEVIKTESIAKIAHKYDSGKVTKAATCKATGVKTYTCSVCKGTKTATIAKLTTHTYSSNCDKYCDVCGTTRKVGAHKYSNSCDTTCNYCNAKRTIKHTYSNNCDTSCNVCKATRTIAHTYKTTTTKATLAKSGSIVKKCTVCGKVASKTAIKYVKTFKLSTTTYTYNGKVKTPSVTVKDSVGKTLKKNTDYTVSYASGRKNVGTYKVTIKMIGKYSGTKTLTFKITPAKTTVSKLTAGKKSIKVAITKKSKQVTGYQIQYSTSKKFTSAKTKTISSYKTTKCTLKSLSAKKTYYVRVRTYKTVGKTKYYSGWSTYKYVKTK